MFMFTGKGSVYSSSVFFPLVLTLWSCGSCELSQIPLSFFCFFFFHEVVYIGLTVLSSLNVSRTFQGKSMSMKFPRSNFLIFLCYLSNLHLSRCVSFCCCLLPFIPSA